ncbi:MAG: hypothetical protein LBR39_02895 [Coriobacteriales bacterium]|jgi:hypothetical protein|nr:hypothetical protein [Coriobacteriales bacterium]
MMEASKGGVKTGNRFGKTKVLLLFLAAAFAVLAVLGVLQATGVWKTAAVNPSWSAPAFYVVLLGITLVIRGVLSRLR